MQIAKRIHIARLAEVSMPDQKSCHFHAIGFVSNNDSRTIRLMKNGLGKKLQPVGSRRGQISRHDIEPLLSDQGNSLIGRVRMVNAVRPLQLFRQGLADVAQQRLITHKKSFVLHHHLPSAFASAGLTYLKPKEAGLERHKSAPNIPNKHDKHGSLCV
ncbi:MAG TPA: hypothetical protein VI282_19925 [Verrucomicrobiae bacterium]